MILSSIANSDLRWMDGWLPWVSIPLFYASVNLTFSHSDSTFLLSFSPFSSKAFDPMTQTLFATSKSKGNPSNQSKPPHPSNTYTYIYILPIHLPSWMKSNKEFTHRIKALNSPNALSSHHKSQEDAWINSLTCSANFPTLKKSTSCFPHRPLLIN
jgi:hypothetical protein